MKICILGQGYIGLPTAALFSLNHCEVIGVDIFEDMINNLNKGIIHIEEPGISKIIKKAIESNVYRASLIPEKADAFIITVPTPYIVENYSCDLSYVTTACKSILPYIEKGNTVIIESTIAPMSTDDVIKPIFENAGFIIGEDLFLAHCPERVIPGKIIDELIHNDRIIGGVTPKCAVKASEVYDQFVEGELILTEAKTAELSKCMENTFRDVNIALANELTKICTEIGVNVLDVIEMANKHPRVNLHSPGPGVGGHCLAIDPYFIYAKAPKTAHIIKLARDTNKSMPDFVCENVEKIISKGKIAILGVSYKGNIGDDRESPSYEIIAKLCSKYEISIHDPHIDNPNFVSLGTAVNGADLILVLCDHNEFKNMDYDLIKDKMEKAIIFDTKNIIKEVPDDIKLFNYGNLYSI
ncbi:MULTISPECIES: nucleotide sugar dehydrogenase [Methanobrevibacter]|uniref:UDP-N-acetyl-D-mannosamine dehydrogenase n=1 Tax=Methanobrevibacter gottschalkii DSM 11977 TaxID=1122229 RepID=A0A3N5BRY4_9EURY|nr:MULTISPECIES: nucleotide sugar dehydrogenase [Methanobrevibacter]OEC94251.1 UDP-N-acetyl-D-mannosamine dehydrogenase [Methanobrevibacter sp. A27]RPF52478.1 UDP-N-acetyl-D-mannosaminuronic acid dehydrogenase [Methanobrevibacter gottschalkii DSM 11977]